MTIKAKKQFISPTTSSKKYSLEEYFEMEYSAETRHEFVNGEIRAMAYTSESHGLIITNIIRIIANCILEKDCKVFAGDRMLYIEKCKKVYYPDVLLLCGEIQSLEYSKKMRATLNPTVLIEVISDSTASVDRVEKMKCYREIASLQQYILVSQDEKNLEIVSRVPEKEDTWETVIRKKDEQKVKIGDCEMLLSEIYWKVTF
jgi:Uma2 family endonuclease